MSLWTRWREYCLDAASRIEIAIENKFNRLIFCLGTVALVVAYVIAGSRIAEPPRWTDSRYLEIEESRVKVNAFQLDLLNRSIQRLHRVAEILAVKSHKLKFSLVEADLEKPEHFEQRVVVLWLDELNGYAPEGLLEVRREAVARAVLAIVRSSPTRMSSWYAHVKTLREVCESGAPASLHGLCTHLRDNPKSTWGDRATPMSLVPWIAAQIEEEASGFSASGRLAYLRSLARARGGNISWSEDPLQYGTTLKKLIAEIAPSQVTTFHTQADLVLVRRCDSPNVREVAEIQAERVLWLKECGGSKAEIDLETFDLPKFAKANPGLRFVEVGREALALAQSRGWVKPTDEVATLAHHSDKLRAQVRPQDQVTIAGMRVRVMRAPVDVIRAWR